MDPPLFAVSRDQMLSLKAVTDEEFRQAKIKRIIQQVYQLAIQSAKTSSQTYYNFPCQDQPSPDIENILDGLRKLFPGCKVEFKSLMQGRDGKMYDLSTKMDPNLLQFINNQRTQTCIVVDWS